MSANTDTDRPATSAIQTLIDELETLRERVSTLDSDLERKENRLARLRSDLAQAHDETDRLESNLECTREANGRLEERVTALEQARTPTTARLDAHEKKLEANKARVGELQARELEKGAHLLEDSVDRTAIEVTDGRLERIRKDEGKSYVRVPESDDPLERGGPVTLAHGDLLPIQQLARMDDDMLRSATSSLPARLAAKLWTARVDPAVGDDPWKTGCKTVREYVTAGDMKHWIRRQEPGISDSYAKKLVSRTIDALLDLSKNRLAIRKRRQRKNGLEYTERHVLLPADADVPGETVTRARTGTHPETGDVDG